MKNEKLLSTKIKDGVKKGLFATLKVNANSSGCYISISLKRQRVLKSLKTSNDQIDFKQSRPHLMQR